MVTTRALDLAAVTEAVESVVDPEIPVLTIADLGILRSVEVSEDGVVVTITPTYSGCPALRQIEGDIVTALERVGIDEVALRTEYHPAWTTDWITAEGHRKLAEFGIAPPTAPTEVICPNCSGESPRVISWFGSTACKALMVCSVCGEPFDSFKVHR